MAAPKPGQVVRGSHSGRPIMAVLDQLGRRWYLRVTWELRDEPLSFRELQRRCGMASPNILATRLSEGVEAGTIERDDQGRYALSGRGRELGAILLELDSWANRWAKQLRTKPGRRRSPSTPVRPRKRARRPSTPAARIG